MSDETQSIESKSQNVPKCPNGEMHLSDSQWMAIELMLIGHSMCDISEAVGVDRRTLYRWRKEEAFAEALAQRREEIWSGAAERLVSLVDPAIDVLQRQLRDRHDRSRFRAAAAILRLVDVRKAMSPRNL